MLFGGGEQQAMVAGARARVDLEHKALERPDRLAVDRDGAVGGDRDGKRGVALPRVADQQRKAAVDEALRERGVQRVGEARFEVLCALGPARAARDPVAALRDEAERAHRRDPARELVDVAVGVVEPREAFGEPVGIDHPVAARPPLPEPQHGAAVMFGAELLKIGEAADVPEPCDRLGLVRAHPHFHVADQMLQHRDVDRLGRGAQRRLAGRLREVGEQHVERIVARGRVAPEQAGERRKMMPLDRQDFLGREAALRQADGAEAAVLLVPPGAPRDLRHFGDRQAAEAASVEFLQAREGDMLDVEVEPHADRVGRDEIIDLARLEHRDLRVARLGAERAHDDRGAAREAAQHFGDCVHFFRREGDDGRAFGQSGQLRRSGIAQGREARAGDDLRLGDETSDQTLGSRRAEDHRLLAAARAEQAVGEDMAALGIGAELDLVDADEGDVAVDRQRLHRPEQIARARRHDPLFARHQRDLGRPLDRDHAVVNLAREQAQREADHAARMGGQTLDRQMGFAGVGGAKDSLDRGGREGRHCLSAKLTWSARTCNK